MLNVIDDNNSEQDATRHRSWPASTLTSRTGQPPTPDTASLHISSSLDMSNADTVSSASTVLVRRPPDMVCPNRGYVCHSRSTVSKGKIPTCDRVPDASEIGAILLSPPDSNQCDYFKDTLFERTQLSAQQQLKQLLYNEQLDAPHPSQPLHSMQQHLGTYASDASLNTVLRELFLRLPVSAKSTNSQ